MGERELAPERAEFDCPKCQGRASAYTRSKFWADVDGVRQYMASCESCGPIHPRHPVLYVNAVCVSCAGRLTWATQYDTAADRSRYPLICAACASLADAGMQFSQDGQSRLAMKIHKLDVAYDRVWLRSGAMPTRSRMLHRFAPDPVVDIPARRKKLHEQLVTRTREQPAATVHANDLPRDTIFG